MSNSQPTGKPTGKPPGDPSNPCAKHARSTGNPCKHPAGFKTDTPGKGPCYLHGGKSTGPPADNKNAVTTGEHETIHLSALPAAEKALYGSLSVSPLEQATAHIRLLSIREHRILLRINAAEETSDEGFHASHVTWHDGWNVKGKIKYSTTEWDSTLTTVMHLEAALTRVQAMKTKAIDTLRDCIKDAPPDTDGLSAIVAAIDRSAALLLERDWEDRDATGAGLTGTRAEPIIVDAKRLP